MDYERTFTLEDIVESEARAKQEGHPFVIAEAEGRAIGRIGLNQFRERDRICSLYVLIGEHDTWGRTFGRDAISGHLGVGVRDLRPPHDRAVDALGRTSERSERTERAASWWTRRFANDRYKSDGAFHDRTVMSTTLEGYATARERFDRELDERRALNTLRRNDIHDPTSSCQSLF